MNNTRLVQEHKVKLKDQIIISPFNLSPQDMGALLEEKEGWNCVTGLRKYSYSVTTYCKRFLLIVVFVLMIVLGIMSIYTDTIVQSSITPPEFQVQSVNTTTPFTVDNLATTVNGGFNMTFWVANPFRGSIYNKATLEVYYRSLLLSSSTPFDTLCPQKPSCIHVTQSWLPVTINVSSVPVSDPVTASDIMSDLRREELSLNVTLVADFRGKHTQIDTPSEMRVTCNDVKVGVPNGVMMGGPKNCKVDWSRFTDTDSNRLTFISCFFAASGFFIVFLRLLFTSLCD